MSTQCIGIALVVDTRDSYDDYGVQVVDLNSILPLGNQIYVISTKKLDDTSFAHGAGKPFTKEELLSIIEALKKEIK